MNAARFLPLLLLPGKKIRIGGYAYAVEAAGAGS